MNDPVTVSPTMPSAAQFPEAPVATAVKVKVIGAAEADEAATIIPNDSRRLYERTPIGLGVRVVNEPVQIGWIGEDLFIDVHPPPGLPDLGGPAAGSRARRQPRRAASPGGGRPERPHRLGSGREGAQGAAGGSDASDPSRVKGFPVSLTSCGYMGCFAPEGKTWIMAISLQDFP